MSNDPQERKRLKEHFQSVPASKHTSSWDDLWQQEFTPWDRKGPSAALRDAVTQHPDLFPSPIDSSGNRKKALVPGCGRGYDVLNLASLGYDTYGLDASSTAISAANKLRAESWDNDSTSPYLPHDPAIPRGNPVFLFNDFFKDDFLSETKGASFDIIFDYTFLCALPHELRPSWAKRMSQLLAPNGRLICLEWPLGKDPLDGGPPHGLTSPLYQKLFLRPGENVRYDDKSHIIEDASVEPAKDSLVRVAHYMPERTHEAGKGKDYISIWTHRA